MFTDVEMRTIEVFTVKLALVAPAGMVTLEGTEAKPGLLLERETTVPPAGAGPLSVTVPVEDCTPPITLDGFSVNEERVTCGGVTVSEPVLFAPPKEAEIVTVVDAATAPVVTVKLALLPPAATVTLDGTAAAPGLLLERETTAPPVGAGTLRVTVPVDDSSQPMTLVGLPVSADRATRGGTPFPYATLFRSPKEAEIVTVVDAATAPVVTVKLALPPPAGTVTLDGTAAAPGLLLERETTAPPMGAGTLRVTVPVDDCVPPITLVGLRVSADRATGGGVTVNEAVLLAPPKEAEIVTVVDAATAPVVTVKLALPAPAGTVTLD